jgi:hypothetical protein
VAPAAPATTAATATNPSARPPVTTEARPRDGGAAGPAVVDGGDLDVLMVPASVELLVLDAHVGEMDLLVEVGQVVFKRPGLNLVLVAVGVSIGILSVPIALMQPPLVLTLELVVQDHSINVRAPRSAKGSALLRYAR